MHYCCPDWYVANLGSVSDKNIELDTLGLFQEYMYMLNCCDKLHVIGECIFRTLVCMYWYRLQTFETIPDIYAYFICRTFENLYVGWGHKYSAENYSPPPPPPIQEEFPSAPEITEAEDPSPEEEAALRTAQQEAAEAAEEMEEAEEEDEEDD